MKTTLFPVVLLTGFSWLAAAGCSPDATDPTTPSAPKTQDTVEAGGHDHDHAHPSEGPHHGDLVELGNEEYHAELVHPEHGDDPEITIYILDGSGKSAVPIEAAKIAVNLSHAGKAEQFQLAASPDKGDPAGKSSRFVSDDKDLLSHFGEEEIKGQLVVTINGKSYRGNIEHDHDHEGHDHDDDHKGHDHKD